ncbi:MAG: Trp biosynthesis-associated membrane protein [Aeromicrobium sp.]
MLGTLAAGGLALFALGRTWANSKVVAEGLTADKVSATGSDAHPLAAALAVVIVASALAILAASKRIRQAVGVFTALVSLIAIWIIVFDGDSLDGAITKAVEKSPAFTGANHPDAISESIWSYVALAAFVVAVVLGVVTTRLASSWPTMSSRYDAPPVRPSAQATQDDEDMWKALDEGRDPTQ